MTPVNYLLQKLRNRSSYGMAVNGRSWGFNVSET